MGRRSKRAVFEAKRAATPRRHDARSRAKLCELQTDSGEQLKRDQRLRLWRARFRSLRFLCLRIFFRRFLMTLPKASPYGRKPRTNTRYEARSQISARAGSTGGPGARF